MGERTYLCLICNETIEGRLRASMHVRACHEDELDGERHVDEFIVLTGPVEYDEDSRVPPFFCLHCDGNKSWPTEAQTRSHCAAAHELVADFLRYGVDYISKLDQDIETSKSEAEMSRRLENAVAAIHEWQTVSDFLTDCGEEFPDVCD